MSGVGGISRLYRRGGSTTGRSPSMVEGTQAGGPHPAASPQRGGRKGGGGRGDSPVTGGNGVPGDPGAATAPRLGFFFLIFFPGFKSRGSSEPAGEYVGRVEARPR